MKPMANTSTRTLRLLSLLQAQRYWAGRELAGRLGVSARTLRRDVDRLRELGYPVEAHRGVDGGYQLAAGAALPPLVVDDEEAVALAVGLQTAAQGAVEGIADSSVRALAKVVQVMPGRLRRRVEALAAMTVPAAWDAGWQSSEVSQSALDPDGPDHDGAGLPGLRADPVRVHGGERSPEHPARRAAPAGLAWAAAGTWSATTWTGTTGAASGWTARSGPAGSGARFRPRELPARGCRGLRPGRDQLRALEHGYEVEAVVDAPGRPGPRSKIGRWATVEPAGGGPLPDPDEHRFSWTGR